MKSNSHRVVLVTCANLAEAKKIARTVVERRLAACVNIFPQPIHSVYRWKEKVETAREYLLLIKTVDEQLDALQRAIKDLHSYDVPEFIALPILGGSSEYLQWLSENTKQTKAKGNGAKN
jgi:periplasmic divalent cation tolerance protein